MSRVESHGPDPRFAVRVEGRQQDSRVVRLDMSQAELLSAVVSRALQNEPHFKYLMPNEQARRAVLPWFFRSVAIPACQLFGEIYTTDTIEGGALWTSPGHTLSFEQMVRTEILTMPFKLGGTSFRCCINLGTHVEAIRKRLAGGPHWYLVAHAMEPSEEEGALTP